MECQSQRLNLFMIKRHHWFDQGRPDDFSIDCIAQQDVERIYHMLADLKEKSLQGLGEKV